MGLRHRIGLTLGASAAFALALWALALAWADLATTSARADLSRWEETGLVPGPAAWQRAHRRFTAARAIAPRDADHAAALGRLHQWQALAFPLDGEASGAHRAYAAGYHAEALRWRPTWGLAWAQLAENRVLDEGLDVTALLALERASGLAPWEPGVQRRILWLGLALWASMPDDARDTVARALERSILTERDIETTARMAVEHGWEERVAAVVRDDNQRRVLQIVIRQLRGGQ